MPPYSNVCVLCTLNDPLSFIDSNILRLPGSKLKGWRTPNQSYKVGLRRRYIMYPYYVFLNLFVLCWTIHVWFLKKIISTLQAKSNAVLLEKHKISLLEQRLALEQDVCARIPLPDSEISSPLLNSILDSELFRYQFNISFRVVQILKIKVG